MKSKIKIAFVKFAGLAAGGTEKALQTIAAHLPKDKFEVTYFYCDAAPYIGSDFEHPTTDPSRKEYVETSGVRLVKFNVGYKDVRQPHHPWVDTDFWEKFAEEDFDILQTARAGHAEYPYTEINKIDQIDLVTLPGMAERKTNVYKTVHISQYQANSWVRAGGDASKVEIIPLFDEIPENITENFRTKLGIDEEVFVFGLHQRNDDGIFSPVPLEAYRDLQGEDTAFVLLGGSKKYREQAVNLGLKNFYALEHTGNSEVIHKFLNTLNAYTHGRADGETFGLSIAEALYHSLPVVSHVAPAMGHVETIGPAGTVVNTFEEYVKEMKTLKNDSQYYLQRSKAAKKHFIQNLSLEENIQRWVSLYEACLNKKSLDDMDAEEFWGSLW